MLGVHCENSDLSLSKRDLVRIYREAGLDTKYVAFLVIDESGVILSAGNNVEDAIADYYFSHIDNSWWSTDKADREFEKFSYYIEKDLEKNDSTYIDSYTQIVKRSLHGF